MKFLRADENYEENLQIYDVVNNASISICAN